jgi:twinkle protein
LQKQQYDNKDVGFKETHKTCPICNHKKCLGVNPDGSAWCFSCKTRIKDYKKYMANPSANQITELSTSKAKLNSDSTSIYSPLSDRKISEKTAREYGVKLVFSSLDGSISEHSYPYYNDNGDKVATKKRKVKDKEFYWEGNHSESRLFGEQLFKSGKYITITEGECDAMAAYQLTGSKWACVSIKDGAGNAERDIKNSLEFLEQFDNVVICFDNDKQGKEAAKKAARLLKPGKAKIMSLPDGFKDANDMLKENKHKKFTDCFWKAKTYTPAGVMNISERRSAFHEREKKKSVPYPFAGLNRKLYGLRQGELVTLTGGTGLGKSSVTRELEHWLLKETGDNVGVISLEEDWRRTVDGILSIEANARLYIDQVREEYSKEELDGFFDILTDEEDKNKLWVHAHFGTNDIEEIFSKLRFMIIGCNCKWIIMDHLHMLVSAIHMGDERRGIDAIMTRLRSIVEETSAGLILVSHLRRVEGNKGHENGIQVNLSHLRGSQSIAQLSDSVIALERNQQADDPEEANTTVLRVLKSRYTGDVGYATKLFYNKETGRLSEPVFDSFEEEASSEVLEWN